MAKNKIFGIVRHLLTTGGGVLASYGWISEGSVSEVVGALVVLTGFVWSLIDKKADA